MKQAAIHKPDIIWCVIAVIIVAFIWGNSMVPAEGSESLSLGALKAIKGFLASVGIPNDWITDHLVRKTAHFTEYMVLGLATMQATKPWRAVVGQRWPWALATAAFLVIIPTIDEFGIQLHVPGRAAMITDVLLDCCGAATGVILTLLVITIIRRRRSSSRQAD